MSWLTGGLGDVGVQLPKDLSLKSIVTFFLQLMGITWPRIRKILAKHVGEKNVALLEKVYSLVSFLIEKGPEGIYEMIKEKLDPQSIVDQVVQLAVDFLISAVVKAVSARIILLFNPVGAIAQALEAIYRVLKWIFQNAARIFTLIETVVNGVADILAGSIGGFANAVEKALGMLIAPVISFLADYLGFGDLPEKIAEKIKSFQEWILGLIEKALVWIIEKGKALLEAMGLGGKDKKKKPGEGEGQVGKDMEWTAEGEQHHLWIATTGAHAQVMVASETKTVDHQLKEYKKLAEKLDAKKKADVLAKIGAAESEHAKLNKEANQMVADVKKPEPDPSKTNSEEVAVESAESVLVTLLKGIQQALGLAGDFGTEHNPIPLDWPKRRLSAYPTIYAGPRTKTDGEGIDQSLLQAGNRMEIKKKLSKDQADEWTSRNEEIVAYQANKEGQTLPNGNSVGVAEENRIDVGFKILMTESGSTGGGGKINDLFRPFGYRPSKEHKDGDHVVERQLGGRDAIDNLWPLESAENQNSGRVLKDMKFEDPKGKEVKMKELKERPEKPVVFQIKSTK